MYHRVPRRRRLAVCVAICLAAAPVGAALAADECGSVAAGITVSCAPTTTPYAQIRYEGVTDFDLVIESGAVVDGTLLPEPDTAVVVYGEGALSLTAQDGSVIRNEGWSAIDIVSNSGPVAVRVDEVHGGYAGVAALANGNVSVRGNRVEGDIAILAESLGGDVEVDVGLAVGRGAGVFASTAEGDVHILAGEAYGVGDVATGLWGVSENGSVVIDAGFVRTEGLFTQAIRAESWTGGDVTINAGGAVALGDYGAGIVGVAVDGDVIVNAEWASTDGVASVGIAAISANHGVSVNAGGVSTSGDYSRGIDIAAVTDVVVTNDSVSTLGMDSAAISIETTGQVDVDTERLMTFGNDSYGLRVLTGDDVLLDVAEITTYGERAAALYAESGTGDVAVRLGTVHTWATTGDWFAVGLNAGEGDVSALVEHEVRADSGVAITAASWTGGATIGIAEGAAVYGQFMAIDTATADGTRIDVAGTVESGTGPVIKVRGNDNDVGAADIRIASTGEVRGFLDLSEGGDALANAGTFATSGTNLFGAGDDRFANTGRVALLGDATSMAFEGLEQFDNAGVVTLANGRTGDALALDGTLHGEVGSTLGIDLDIVAGTADLVEVGALSGTTALDLHVLGRGSALGIGGIRVVTSGSAQTGRELVLADGSAKRGFIGFRLDHDGQDSWLLRSDLADEAYLAGAVPAGMRDLWRQGIESVSTHLVATHDDTDAGGVWFQVLGGDFEGTSNLSHALGSRELEWQGSHQGAQLGAEMGAGDWRVGVTGGYGKASMDLGGSEETRLDSLNLGLYARWENGGGWYADGVLRGERIDLETHWRSIGLEDDGDGSALGVSLEGGRRFDVGRAWFEPNLRVSWIDVSLPDQAGTGGDVRWEDSALATGELGLRVGMDALGNGLRPYASAAVAREFGSGDTTVFVIGNETARVTDEGDRAFARFAGGVEWTLGNVDLYGEIEGRTGDMEGVGGRLGLRMRF